MNKKIILHIGLPKTATTWFQKAILPKLDLKYILWQHESYRPVISSLQSFFRIANYNASETAAKLSSLLNSESSEDTLLISNENISVKITDFWDFKAVRYEDLVTRSIELRNELKNSDVDLSLVFVTRDQPEWLASRYAESAKRHPQFSQEHFHKHVVSKEFQNCVKSSVLSYDRLKKTIDRYEAQDWFTLLEYETLISDRVKFIEGLAGACDIALSSEDQKELSSKVEKKLNELQNSSKTWFLKNSEDTVSDKKLTLTEELAEAIRGNFEKPSPVQVPMRSKRAILVLSVGDRPWVSSACLTWQNYADKCNADLIVERELPSLEEFPLDELPDKPGRANKRAYACKAYLPWKYLKKGYEQVLMLDDTCCVSKEADNIFELAPKDCVALTRTGVEHALESFRYIVERAKKEKLPFINNFNTLDYGNTGVVLYNKSNIDALSPEKIIKASSLLFNKLPHQTLFYYLMRTGKVPFKMLSGDFNKVPGINAGITLDERKNLKEIGDLFDENIQIYHITGMSRNRRSLIEDIVKRQGY